MRAAPILAALALAGCADAGGPASDFAGRPYPPQCRGDLSHIEVPIIEMDRAQLQIAAANSGSGAPHGATVYGLHLRLGTASIIYIDKSLMGWPREDVIRHERCHEIAGNWHK